jgi:transcriptional/translational regulatory protein YebC/TACO1
MFDRKGQISFAPGVDEDALMEAALEAGADDVVTNDDGSIDVFTSFADFIAVNEALTAAGFKGEEAEISMIPSTTATLDLETAQKVLKLIDMLEDLDDVQNVYSNADIPEEVMAQLG